MHQTRPFPRSSLIVCLAIVIGVLATVAATAGLFWPAGDGPATITTYRGQEVELLGDGVYRDSSAFTGAGARGTDLVTLLVAVPLLAAGLVLHRRGSVRGGLLLAGALTWFLYVYGSLALGSVAYNSLFLLYVALFATSLWAIALLLAATDEPALASRLAPAFPRRGLGGFLIASGAVTTMIWLIEPVTALLTGDLPPSLGVSTTLLTTALDMAVIAPATWIAGRLVLRGQATGYLASVPLLVLEALLAPMIVAQTWLQLDSGVELSTGEIVGPVAGFLVLATIAIWMLARTLRHIEEPAGTERPVERAGGPVTAD